MKNMVFILLSLLMGFLTYAQDKKKNAKYEIAVNGNCDLCKKRIEKAAYSVAGVKSAVWTSEDSTLHLIINEKKTDEKAIKQSVAKAGHDTDEIKATDEAYNELHHCCMYQRN